MEKSGNNKELNKAAKDKSEKKDAHSKPRMKKPGDKGFVPREDKEGDGSAGIGGTSAI